MRRRFAARLLPVGFLATTRRRSYVRTVVSGYGYTATATAVNFALIPILVGGLGKTGYGIWLTTAALVQWAGYPTGLLVPGFVKKIGESLARQNLNDAASVIRNARIVYRAILVIVVLAVLLLATQAQLGFLGGELDTDTRLTIVLAASWLGFQIASQVEIAVLTAAQRLYVVHTIQACVIAASGVAAGALVLAGFGLAAVAASYAAGAAIGLGALKRDRRRVVGVPRARRSFDSTAARDVVSTTIPYLFSGAGWILLTSDIILLALLTSPEVVAAYGIVYKVTDAMLQVIWRVADAGQPYIVEFNARDDREGLRRLYRRTTEASLMIAGCFAAAFFFLGDRFLDAWVGAGQAAGPDVVRVLSVYVIVNAFVHANVIFPFSTARMRVIGRLQLAEGAAKVVLAVVLIEAIGSVGAALASAAAITVATGWYVPRYTMRWLRIDAPRYFVRLAERALLLPVLVGLAAWIASELVHDGYSARAVAAAGAVLALGLGSGIAATIRLRARGA